jgi:tetratricopeptide (TPR) repeat protein
MRKLFFIVLMFFVVSVVSAQAPEKTFAELKNEGNLANKAKDYAKALELYEQAMILWGDKPIVDTSMIYNMGLWAKSTKNYDKALKYFDQSISMNYKKVNSLVNESDIYSLMKKNAESLKALESALSLAPEDPKVKSKLASYYVKEATAFYTKGSDIMAKVNAQITAGKLKTVEEQKKAEEPAIVEFKKALPLIEKALGYDSANATAKQLKTACEQAIKG